MAKKQRNELVKKSNALIRAQWTIKSVLEPRIVAILASKVHKDDVDFKIYEVPISDILGPKYGGENAKELVTVVDNIMGRVLTIRESDTRVHKYNVFSRCTIDTKKGVLELRFDADLKPHYLQLHANFTEYKLAEFMSLPSVYSQRIYEFLKSWDDKPEVIADMEDLHNMLDTPKSLRENFKAFRVRVLEKAHKDIVEREGSTLWFDWEPIKRGRGGKVAAVRFTFSETRAQEFKKNQPPPDERFVHQQLQRQSNACFERLAKRGQSCTPNFKSEKCKFCAARGRMSLRSRQRELNIEGGGK
jgi:plasmid replication initiation protein